MHCVKDALPRQTVIALISQATLHDDKKTGQMGDTATRLALTPDRDPLLHINPGMGVPARAGRRITLFFSPRQ